MAAIVAGVVVAPVVVKDSKIRYSPQVLFESPPHRRLHEVAGKMAVGAWVLPQRQTVDDNDVM